uniref:RGS domain-containing protein n=1 Tax=Aplanochytrium stocchinoi TaxID=215587 RepID=A0A7S3PFG5_9STRA|mmetsp:Transcript_18094/g.22241  ORF Transcript_18094/g.22241 Transcript_18094/m.22241 type:complete len:177 (+) Transcript_18094:121-651(+)
MANVTLGATLRAPLKVDGVSFEEVATGVAPFPLSTFESYINDELAGENLDFFRDVRTFKAKYEKYDAGTLASDPVKSEFIRSCFNIIDRYVAPGSEYEVNLSGENRKKLLENVFNVEQENSVVSSDIFDSAQQEIFGLMAVDTYPRFLRLLKSRNLSDKLAREVTFPSCFIIQRKL